jgi:hypothetical protein
MAWLVEFEPAPAMTRARPPAISTAVRVTLSCSAGDRVPRKPRMRRGELTRRGCFTGSGISLPSLRRRRPRWTRFAFKHQLLRTIAIALDLAVDLGLDLGSDPEEIAKAAIKRLNLPNAR